MIHLCYKLSGIGPTLITSRIAAKRQIAGIKFTHRPKIRLFAPQDDSLRRFTSNLAWPTGTWVRLQRARGGNGMRPQDMKNFHFLVKSRLAGANPLTDFWNFYGLSLFSYAQLSCICVPNLTWFASQGTEWFVTRAPYQLFIGLFWYCLHRLSALIALSEALGSSYFCC